MEREKKEGDQGIGKSKGGTISKIHIIAAGSDEGIDFSITGGEVSDIKAGLEIIKQDTFSQENEYLVMDKGYSSYIMIELCESKGIIAVVPPKTSFKKQWEYNKWIYMYRNEIERLFGRLKHFRRISTRFDKLERRYKAFVMLGMILRILKVYVNTA